MSARLIVEFAPHWVNGWFIRAAYHPWVGIDDGAPVRASWREVVELTVDAGEHRVTTHLTWRTKSARSRISERDVRVTAAEGETVRLRVRNGPLNQDPFIPRVVTERS